MYDELFVLYIITYLWYKYKYASTVVLNELIGKLLKNNSRNDGINGNNDADKYFSNNSQNGFKFDDTENHGFNYNKGVDFRRERELTSLTVMSSPLLTSQVRACVRTNARFYLMRYSFILLDLLIFYFKGCCWFFQANIII